MRNVSNNQITETKETYVSVVEMSRLMNADLDPESLTICVRLCEAGVNPDALATVIREIRKEVAKFRENGEDNNSHH